MIQSSSSSARYSGVRIQSRQKRRPGRNHSKITPKDSDSKHADLSDFGVSQVSSFWTTPKHTSSQVWDNGNSYPRTITPFRPSNTITDQRISSSSRITESLELHTSFNDNSNAFLTNNDRYNRVKDTNSSKEYNPIWKYILKILYSILGILLLTALILPSILVFILAPKTSQTEMPELPTYTNHCAGVSLKSLWEAATNISITMKINTSECKFKETPLYFVSIAGVSNHFCLTGYGAIYLPTKDSFEIYTESICGVWTSTYLLSQAAANGWDINWVGFYR